MSKIFISHSSKDKDFVNKLAHSLLINNIPIWLDTYELSVGDSLYDKIYLAIKECNFLIVVISENYNNTIWTSKEFKAILSKEDTDNKKYLIPIKIDNCNVPLEISDRIYQNFNTDYNNSIKQLIRFFRKEDYSIRSIPLSTRQIILNFSEFGDVDIELIKSILSDLHLHKNEIILKKQLFFNSYQMIDELLLTGETNIKSIPDNKAIFDQFNKDTRNIENYIDCIVKGVVLILNNYRLDNNIELLSISIYWFSKIFMETIRSIIIRYLTKEQLVEQHLSDYHYSFFPISSNITFSKFYNVNGYEKIDIYDKNDKYINFSIIVDEDCYAYRELKKFPVLTISEAFSIDFLYKHLIPQNVFSKVRNEERTHLITNFKNYLVGLG